MNKTKLKLKDLKDKFRENIASKRQDFSDLFEKVKISLEEKKNKFNLTKDIPKLSGLNESIQEKLYNIFESLPNQVVLRQSRFWSRAITWTLIGGTAFSISWLMIAKTDEVVIALGKLEPKMGVVDVQMPLEGIVSEILIKEGDRVKKGQVLIRLDTKITKARNYALTKNLELNELVIKKLSYLVKEGAVSELQYLQKKAETEGLRSELNANKVTLSYQEIVSPIDGTVFELEPKGPGFVVRASQPVVKIVPVDNLIAKIEIDSRTIGFVRPGSQVEVSIDSFPASDFGVLTGTLTSIGSDALEPSPQLGKGFRFPAKITLDNQYLELTSGKRLPLKAGMSLNANIKLRKVTYIQLLLNNFTDKAKSLQSI
ncbi:HlyD family secretion protein [Prochlorococcus marinus]|uniref:HlyD family secretion protein n=1 Tax=Prochlorococcus marinus TaxID=1219 RepID=UPI0022B3681B|nr:efflux RND transporter periplasmic adaptor subunit [Prochlorococcus marinus]